MKPVLALLVLFLSALAAPPPAAAAPADIERITVNGSTYLRARDWARVSGLEPGWVVREKSLQLANRSSRILLTMDSREIQFNGLSVAFSHPVAYKGGAVYVSKLDADTVLAPLVAPPRNAAGRRIKTICIDPGHGGKDPGYQVGSRQEKKYTLLFAQELRDALVRQGFQVVLTRKRDAFVDLPDRAAAANRAGADLFLSLHFNAFPQDPSVRGSETYCLTPAGASSSNAGGAGAGSGSSRGNANNAANLWLAFQMQKSLVWLPGMADRGVKRARYAVLRDAAMPAVLIEAGFMSNSAEGKKIYDSAARKKLAAALANGVMAYKKSVERAD